jgi:hypothetical protein
VNTALTISLSPFFTCGFALCLLLTVIVGFLFLEIQPALSVRHDFQGREASRRGESVADERDGRFKVAQ